MNPLGFAINRKNGAVTLRLPLVRHQPFCDVVWGTLDVAKCDTIVSRTIGGVGRIARRHTREVGSVAPVDARRHEEPRGAEGVSLNGIARTNGNGAPASSWPSPRTRSKARPSRTSMCRESTRIVANETLQHSTHQVRDTTLTAALTRRDSSFQIPKRST